jgi:fucose permease
MVMIAMLIGYVAGIAVIPRLITYHTALIISAITGVLFALAAIFTPGSLMLRFPGLQGEVPVTAGFIMLLGLSNALIWPAIWPLAIHNLGRFMKTGSALLIMAIAGGAILPLSWGFLSDQLSERSAYWIMVPCYLFILYYALHGYRIRRWSRKAA